MCLCVCLSQGRAELLCHVMVRTCLSECTFRLSWKVFWILTVYECDRASALGLYCVEIHFSLQSSLALAREKLLIGDLSWARALPGDQQGWGGVGEGLKVEEGAGLCCEAAQILAKVFS